MIIIEIAEETPPSDISDWWVKATCFQCGRQLYAIREDCWEEGGRLLTDDLCSESDSVDQQKRKGCQNG